jgi:hypothetical protein
MKIKHFFVLLFIIPFNGNSQSLDGFFSSEDEKNTVDFTVAFLGERIGTGPSTEMPGAGELNMIISHRFGRLDGGLYEFFGLDQATMRMGFDYGISNRFAAGIGRSSFQKIYDFYLKYKFLEQRNNGSPVSLAMNSTFSYISLRNYFPENHSSFSDKGGLSLLLPVSRIFGESLALQITPAWHRSAYAPELGKEADIYALGGGLRYKITGRIHFTGEYYHILSTPYFNRYSPLTLGFDIDTGGHLFQLVFSNSPGMTEKTYFSDTRNSWKKGEVFFGFNLIRVFYLNN